MTKMKTTDRRPGVTRVLQMLADANAGTGRPVDNPYTALMVESLPRDRIHTRYFRWRGVLLDEFDVLHVHWPEVSLQHPRLLGRVAKAALFTVFLGRLRLQRKAVVRTVHNVQPHEPLGRVQGWLVGCLDRLTTFWIVLNAETPTPDPKRTILIPHGHYRAWYGAQRESEAEPGRLLTFGMIRAYKGVDDLIKAFRSIPARDLSLRVVGEPRDAVTAQRLVDLASGDTRIGLDLRFVDDQVLIDEIAAAEIVVLPYRAMHNSGAALLALSYGRPIIVPSTDATELLAGEFGVAWVTTYDGELDAGALSDSVSAVRTARREPAGPDMSQREWPVLGLLHAEAYEAARRVRG